MESSNDGALNDAPLSSLNSDTHNSTIFTLSLSFMPSVWNLFFQGQIKRNLSCKYTQKFFVLIFPVVDSSNTLINYKYLPHFKACWFASTHSMPSPVSSGAGGNAIWQILEMIQDIYFGCKTVFFDQMVTKTRKSVFHVQMHQVSFWCLLLAGEEIARPRRSTPTPSPVPDTPRSVCRLVLSQKSMLFIRYLTSEKTHKLIAGFCVLLLQ